MFFWQVKGEMNFYLTLIVKKNSSMDFLKSVKTYCHGFLVTSVPYGNQNWSLEKYPNYQHEIRWPKVAAAVEADEKQKHWCFSGVQMALFS